MFGVAANSPIEQLESTLSRESWIAERSAKQILISLPVHLKRERELLAECLNGGRETGDSEKLVALINKALERWDGRIARLHKELDSTETNQAIALITDQRERFEEALKSIDPAQNPETIAAAQELLNGLYEQRSILVGRQEDTLDDSEDDEFGIGVDDDIAELDRVGKALKVVRADILRIEALEIKFIVQAGDGIPRVLQLLDEELIEWSEGLEGYKKEAADLSDHDAARRVVEHTNHIVTLASQRVDLIEAWHEKGLTWIN